MTWLLSILLVVIARAATRRAARRDADEAHRNLAQLLSELVHYRAG